VIYIETSVALAHIFLEPVSPPAEFWSEDLVSSQMLVYEIYTRMHARQLASSRGEIARALVDQITLIDLSHAVLQRALEPFAVPLRTLDALHLATMDYLRRRGETVELASYDKRMVAGARALGIRVWTG
jgi:predicted nucleic acid-binding protein